MQKPSSGRVLELFEDSSEIQRCSCLEWTRQGEVRSFRERWGQSAKGVRLPCDRLVCRYCANRGGKAKFLPSSSPNRETGDSVVKK